MESVLSIRGNATIPKAIREHLHLEPGDRIKSFIHPDGTVVILPKVPTYALKGIVPKRKHPRVSLGKNRQRDCRRRDRQKAPRSAALNRVQYQYHRLLKMVDDRSPALQISFYGGTGGHGIPVL